MLLTLDRDDRVVAVNQRYLQGTGHQRADVLGRVFWDDLLAVGSRMFFHTQLAPVLQLDNRLDEVMVDLRTDDGDRVPALMNVVRRIDPISTAVATHVALMTVPDRRAFEERLRDARAAAEDALAAEADMRQRLELLGRADAALASSLELDVALHRLAQALTAGFADWCLIGIPDPAGAATFRWTVAHSDPLHDSDLEQLADRFQDVARAGSPLEHALRAKVATVVQTGEDVRSRATSGETVRPTDPVLTSRSVVVAPVVARNAHVASVVLGRSAARAAFDADDLADITDVAARTGIVLENLRRHAREHSNSLALQQALLTTPPISAEFDIATRYLPATNGNEVGGDWYDALVRPDGTPVLVIGDVVGHDIQAAAAMGQLRGIIRTVAYTTATSPSEILTRADATARGLGVDVLATAVVARLRRDAGQVTLEWSNAGHPPPLLVTAEGVQVLPADPDRLLGLPSELQRLRSDHVHELQPGDTLVLYTDGLIERTDEAMDESLAALLDRLTHSAAQSPESLCDAILAARQGDTRDDIALLAIRITSAQQ